MADTAPPPSYQSVVAKVEQSVGTNPKPDNVFDVVANLSTAEKQAITSANVDVSKPLEGADKDAFQKGVNDYLASEAAKTRLKATADEATSACALIDKMFSDLAVKLGEVDGKDVGGSQKKFTPEFLDLQKKYRETLHQSTDLALEMSQYGSRWENTILKVCLEGKIPIAVKKEKLKDFIDTASQFETKSKAITDGFDDLKYKFGGFTGSFASWADGAEKKADDRVAQLVKEISDLDQEIADIRQKMLLTGAIGGPALVGVTAGLCAFLGPVGLVAGLIGLGVGLGLMIHWSNEITRREDTKRTKNEQIKQAKTEKDAVIATRNQLTELGRNSLTTFQDQIGKLNSVWTFALNDAKRVELIIKDIDKDIDLIEYETFRQTILQNVGSTQGLYQVMETYLQRYADGVKASEVPKPT